MHCVFGLSVRPSVRPSVTKLVKTSELIFMQIATSGPRGNGMNRSALH